MSKSQTQTLRIEISPKTIFLILGIIAGIAFLLTIRDVLIIFFWSFVFGSAAIPIVKRLTKLKIPRWAAVVLVYLGISILAIGLFSAISVPLAKEVVNLSDNLPTISKRIVGIINKIGELIGLNKDIIETSSIDSSFTPIEEKISEGLKDLLSASAGGFPGIVRLLVSLFGGMLNVFSVFTISFYIALDHDNFLDALLKAIPNRDLSKKIDKLLSDIETKLGNWIVGQFTVSSITGFIIWLMLTIAGVPYALPLALFGFLVDSIPTIGATLATVPTVLILLASGTPVQLIVVIVGYILIQQFENNIVIPRVMSSAIGLPPVVVILTLLVGAKLFGFMGVLLAIPIATILKLILDFISQTNSQD
ncbi:AI-2E family transporter [Candidatus Dojkabacteria bacterium]|nr:AI-2E family transporter [Candidatus Dojkabacteria bacterium]